MPDISDFTRDEQALLRMSVEKHAERQTVLDRAEQLKQAAFAAYDAKHPDEPPVADQLSAAWVRSEQLREDGNRLAMQAMGARNQREFVGTRRRAYRRRTSKPS